MKIADLADIRFGPHLPKSDSGTIKYLNASHFDKLYRLTKFNDSYSSLKPDDKKLIHLLKPSDVIVAGKGYRFFAWNYDPSYGRCIPSSLFYVLTVDPKVVLPEFLALQFNSEKIQKKVTLETAGATVPVLTRKTILDLDIKIPSIKEQSKIISLWETMSCEVSLTEQILDKTKIRNKTIINKLFKEM